MIAPPDRETFDRAQRRHRRSARLRAIPAALAAAVMGIPIGVYLSPVLLALSILVTDLLNLLVPMADLGGAVADRIDGLLDGDIGTIQTVAWILVIWSIPGILFLVAAYLSVAWRLRRIGGEGIALGMGARPPRGDDAQERQLVDVVNELAVAAGIEPPRVLLFDAGPANALIFGQDPDHATVLIARELLDELDREETQGVVARLIASGVDGDLGLAVDIGAVYITLGLVTTTLAAFVSRSARARWRAAVRPLIGLRGDPRADAAGVAGLIGLAADDDQPTNVASGCLALLTMGGLLGIGVSLINLFLSGPLLTLAWRSRGYLADATAVELTRDPDGLARGLIRLSDGERNVPATAWLELLLVVSQAGGGRSVAGTIPRLSDSGLTVSLVPPISNRLGRLRAMGASLTEPADPTPSAQPAIPQRRPPTWLVALIIAPLLALVGVLIVIAAAFIVYLVAIAAFVILALVALPIHEFLRGLVAH